MVATFAILDISLGHETNETTLLFLMTLVIGNLALLAFKNGSNFVF